MRFGVKRRNIGSRFLREVPGALARNGLPSSPRTFKRFEEKPPAGHPESAESAEWVGRHPAGQIGPKAHAQVLEAARHVAQT
jgi:hypothetical protein